jgi:hypothetical protein
MCVDRVVFSAHKAANPEKYPIQDRIRTVYPPLMNIEGRYRPTKVHLQVYDGKSFRNSGKRYGIYTST